MWLMGDMAVMDASRECMPPRDPSMLPRLAKPPLLLLVAPGSDRALPSKLLQPLLLLLREYAARSPESDTKWPWWVVEAKESREEEEGEGARGVVKVVVERAWWRLWRLRAGAPAGVMRHTPSYTLRKPGSRRRKLTCGCMVCKCA